MRILASVLLVCVTSAAMAQDSSFSRLRIRGSLFRNPVSGHISDDWNARTGIQAEVATNIGRSELGLSVGHLAYSPITGKPPFTGTIFTLAWTTPVVRAARTEVSAGILMADLRMDFDDPSLVGGLNTEEEVIIGILGRGRFAFNERVAVFVDGSYGQLMLSTKTPMVLIHAGGEVSLRAPDWLRAVLR